MTPTPLSKAVETLVAELSLGKTEGSYYHSWQSNIAMAFYDEFNRVYGYDHGCEELHQISNDAAKRFLDTLIIATRYTPGSTSL